MYKYHLCGHDHKINASCGKPFVIIFYKRNKQQVKMSVQFSCPAQAVCQVVDDYADTLVAIAAVLISFVVIT